MPSRLPALGLLSFVLLVIALAAARTWLTATLGGQMFTLIVAAVTVSAMGCAAVVSFRLHRGLDEVQKAGAESAARWSLPFGQAVFVLLMFLPPFKDAMTSLVLKFGNPGPGMSVDQSVVVFAMALGFMGVVILQSIAAILLNAIWWKSKQ